MVNQKGQKTMTVSEMQRELRSELRELHRIMTKYHDDNHTAHVDLHKAIGKIGIESSVNTAKLGFFLVFIPILVSTLVGFGFHVVAG